FSFCIKLTQNGPLRNLFPIVTRFQPTHKEGTFPRYAETLGIIQRTTAIFRIIFTLCSKNKHLSFTPYARLSDQRSPGTHNRPKMGDIITVMCLVHGDLPEHAFPIDIKRTKLVGHLKDKIKKKKSPHFKHIAANELTVWCVSIPIDDATALANVVLGNDKKKAIQKLFPEEDIG
ncbi:hypothetical protein BC938DRAFT_483142, partial [Jimgerdemannia flammicorona]